MCVYEVLKSGGYKISALDVEREIIGLDYISEVMVVGVEDDEFGQRVAAAVVLKDPVLTLLYQFPLFHIPSSNKAQPHISVSIQSNSFLLHC